MNNKKWWDILDKLKKVNKDLFKENKLLKEVIEEMTFKCKNYKDITEAMDTLSKKGVRDE